MSSKILSVFKNHIRLYHLKVNHFPSRCSKICYNYNANFENVLNVVQNSKFITPLFYNQNILLSTKSRTKIQEHHSTSFNDLFENLNSYYLANGFVHPEIFIKIIDSVENNELTREQSNFVLESINYLYSLSSAERMKYFDKLWSYLKQNNYINQDKINIAFKIFQQNKITLEEARVYLNDFDNFKNNLSTYEELVRLTCENGDIQKSTTEILEEMREKNFPLTEKVFNSLILGHSRNMDLTKCEAVLDTMNAANLVPSNDTQCELVRAYIDNGLEQKAEIMLDKIIDNLVVNQILKLIKSTALGNYKNLTTKLIDKLPEELRNINDLPGIFKSVCVELLYSKKIDEAFLILDSFPEPNFKENQDIDRFGYFFISELIRSELYTNEKCIEICKKLIESNKNKKAIHVACEICLRKFPQKADYYLKMLSNSEKLRPHYFWPLLNYNFRTKGEIGILNTLKLMSSLSVQCDYETLYYHCFPRLSIIFKNIEECAKSLENAGLKSSTFLTALTSHLLIQQQSKDIIKLNNLYPTKIDTTQLIQPLLNFVGNARLNKSSQQFTNLMKVLINKSENQNYDLAGQILIELISNHKYKRNIIGFYEIVNQFALQNIKISKNSFDILQSQLSKLNQTEEIETVLANLKQMADNQLNFDSSEISDSYITHPRNMNLNELECHLVELEEKKLNTRGVLRRLLQVYVRENQLEKALKIKEKCEELKVHMSPGMSACIFDLHIKLKDLNEAKKSLLYLKKRYPGFLIDEHKIIDLATLMVENDKLEQAKNLILERTSVTRTVGGEYIYRNIWNFLNQVAQYSTRINPDDETNLTKELFFMLRKYKFCQPDNVVLGPIIREHLLKNQIKLAVEEFKFITENFKKTPLQLELMFILVKISNSEEKLENLNLSQEEAKTLLQEVINSTSNIHGSINCNTSLLLAFTESGSENQLRKLLINPEFQINTDALSKNINHLNINGRIENIIKLAKASRGIRNVLNEQELYKMLLNEFIKQNNYQNAIDLFNKLEGDDEFKISSDFVKMLVDLLNINNVTVPNNIALRAQLKI